MEEWELGLGLADAEDLAGQWGRGGLSRDSTNKGTETAKASQRGC